MDRSYKYVIAQFRANPVRDERLNLAVLVFNENDLQLHVARNLEKVRAISAAIDTSVIYQSLDNLKVLDQDLISDGFSDIETRLDLLQSLTPIGLSKFGRFDAPDASSYEVAVERLLKQLVEPEQSVRKANPKKRTRLLSSIKGAFRSEKILARKGETIDSHRIITNQELADGLNADFLLKNGSMHVVQTVDASHAERARKAIQEIGVSALVFEQARIEFGSDQTAPRLIFSASSQLEKSLSPALHAAENQGAELINWESQEDRTRFVVEMSSLAEPTSGQKKVNFGSINASSRGSRNLN